MFFQYFKTMATRYRPLVHFKAAFTICAVIVTVTHPNPARAVASTPLDQTNRTTIINNSSAHKKSKFYKAKERVPGKYIVVLKNKPDIPTDSTPNHLKFAGKHPVSVEKVFEKTAKDQGEMFVIEATDIEAQKIANDPDVDYIEEDGTGTTDSSQLTNFQGWGLDRIDQKSLPLNQTYNYTSTGSGVHVYVIDSGIRTTHEEFGGRASASVGQDFIKDPKTKILLDPANSLTDCFGHGTHVAGIIGGTFYGVAKDVLLHSLRATDCKGGGKETDFLDAINWVTMNGIKPAVVNISFHFPYYSQAVTDAINASINAGFIYVVSSANDGSDACSISPQSVPRAITVGSTDISDIRMNSGPGFISGVGSCVDVYAPGVDIVTADPFNDFATRSISGTSFAAPHVTGVVALYLQKNPTATPADVIKALMSKATPNVISDAGSVTPTILGTPNLLINSILFTNIRGALFRYFNPTSGDHHYTMNWNELNAGNGGPYHFESVQGYLLFGPEPGSQPLYQYFNPAKEDHFFTTNFAELGAGAIGYNYEGIAGYCPTPGFNTTPLYRYRNAKTQHFYTTNFNELGAGAPGWAYEGVACNVYISETSPQTINFFSAPTTLTVGASSVLGATSSSGLAVTFSAQSANCSVSGNTVIGLVPGFACQINADQTGDATFAPATTVIKTFNITAAPIAQTITFSSAPLSLAAGTSGTLGATATSALPVTFSSSTPTICTVTGTSVTAIATGSCIVVANQTGNTTYAAAISVSKTISITAAAKLAQTITFNTAPVTLNVRSTAALLATASSSLPVVYSSTTPTICSVTGATVTGIAPGSCIVAVDQAGNTSYAAATRVTKTIPITATTACTKTSQLLVDPGFEAGNVTTSRWISTFGAGIIDKSPTLPSHLGLWKAWLGGYGVVNTNDIYQTFTVPLNACSVNMSYWLYIKTQETSTVSAFDKLTVTLEDANGVLINTAATYSNLNSTLWVQKAFILTGFQGRVVRLHFKSTEDASLATSFLVDDTALTIVQ